MVFILLHLYHFYLSRVSVCLPKNVTNEKKKEILNKLKSGYNCLQWGLKLVKKNAIFKIPRTLT